MLGKMRTIGSKAEVFHGTAKHTSGGLTKAHLMKTSKGRIVSRKKHAAGKKAIQRLFKAGYKPTKGTFTAMRKGVRTTRRKGMRGGNPTPPPPPTASAQTPQQAAQALQGMMKALTGK
jgi:ABC-type transport system substrate-binding protein